MNGSASKSEVWVDVEGFASVFNGASVTLAVMNCCLDAHPAQRDTPSPLRLPRRGAVRVRRF